MKRKQKRAHKILIIVFILFIAFLLPFIKPYVNQILYREFIDTISKNAITANIKIVLQEQTINGNNSSTSSSSGGSGVIIGKEGNTYFALTAMHVIDELDNIDKTHIIVLGHDELDLRDYLNNYLSDGGKFQGSMEYYQQFPKAAVEYSNSKYDLAVIRFTTDKLYQVLSVSEEIPKFGDTVASMSNPYHNKNVVTAGKIISRKPKPFDDAQGKEQYPVIKHTSAISEGSSGSALLNENLEIVGINLGGGENILRQHIFGMAIPSDYILNFLEEWQQENITETMTPLVR